MYTGKQVCKQTKNLDPPDSLHAQRQNHMVTYSASEPTGPTLQETHTRPKAYGPDGTLPTYQEFIDRVSVSDTLEGKGIEFLLEEFEASQRRFALAQFLLGITPTIKFDQMLPLRQRLYLDTHFTFWNFSGPPPQSVYEKTLQHLEIRKLYYSLYPS